MEVLPIETPALGDRSYLVHDGEAALVIDPQRDTDRVIALAADAGVRITHVAETHVHNDYVTGGFALARAAGASYLVNADDPVAFDRTPVSDGDAVEVGGMRVRVLATPGHTYTHLAYVVEAGGEVAGVFTGGSLLYGSTGRTDLLGHPVGGHLVHHRAGEAGQPGAHAGRAGLRGIAAGRAGRLACLLRPHGPGQPGRARRPRPVAAAARRRRRAPAAHRGR